MNTIHNNGPEDKSLDTDLERLEQAYQQFESEEPPELLDQAILNTARRAVVKKTGWMDFGWIHGLTTVALVVLSLSIFMTQRQPISLEENGMLRSDSAPQLESKSTGPDRSNADNELKEELQFEMPREPGKDMLQNAPEASMVVSPVVSEAGSPARAVEESAAGKQQLDEYRVKKVSSTGEVIEKENAMQANSLTEDMPATQAEATFTDKSSMDEIDADILEPLAPATQAREDQLIQTILVLKRAGNDAWKSELEAFKELYPGYPLPDELKE